MKLKNKILPLLLLASTAVGCTDGFETTNSDPNKLYEVNLQSIFPGTVYKTMNAISELNNNRMWSYSRYITNVAFQTPWNERGDGFYRKFYVEILRDLEELAKAYDDGSLPNSLAVVKTWKAFTYYQLLSLYGPVGLSHAGMDGGTDKRIFDYDSEADAYYSILGWLDQAVDEFDESSTDKILKDPVYNGDVQKWRKLANTLRLEIAMNIQNISEEKAREYAAKSMRHEEWLFSSLDDAFAPKYGTVIDKDCSWYYTRLYKEEIQTKANWGLIPSMNEYFAIYLFSYNDPRMETYFDGSNVYWPARQPYRMTDVLTRSHDCDVSGCSASDQQEHLQWMIDGYEVRDSLRVRYSIPYVPTPDNPGARTPFGWRRPIDPTDPNGTREIPDPLSMNEDNRCYINPRYYAMDATMPLLRWADACFLCAEAKVKFDLGSKDAQTYYEEGIRASFEENGLSASSAAYMAQEGIAWGTSHKGFYDTRKLMTADINGADGKEGQLEQIYKQRWFADFLDGMSAWRMERRTRALNLPPLFLNGSQAYEEGGNMYYGWPERLYFPDAERQTNAEAYYRAIDLLQKNSPKPNAARWGDNIFTMLQFAKPVPNQEEMIASWENIDYVQFNMDFQAKKYGQTYEEFLKNARELTGIKDAEEALDKAYNFLIEATLLVYKVEK